MEGAVPAPELELEAAERGDGHDPLDLEGVVRGGPRLVQDLARGLGHPDHPLAVRVHELVLEVVPHQDAVHVLAREAEAQDPELLALGGGEGHRVLAVGGDGQGLPGPKRLAQHLDVVRLGTGQRGLETRGRGPRLQAQGVEAGVLEAGPLEGGPDRLRPALEQALRPHRPRRLEGALARAHLQVLLDVIQHLLGALGELDLHAWNERALRATEGRSTAPTKMEMRRPRGAVGADSRCSRSDKCLPTVSSDCTTPAPRRLSHGCNLA